MKLSRLCGNQNQATRIFAFNQFLNPEIKDLDDVELKSKVFTQLAPKELAQSWFGNQIYSIDPGL